MAQDREDDEGDPAGRELASAGADLSVQATLLRHVSNPVEILHVRGHPAAAVHSAAFQE
ncbi:hypothetical protein [Streptomyces sp. NPDC054883]